jgi:hypothetical protein
MSGDGLGDGLGLGEGEGLGLGEGEGDGEGLGLGDGEGLGDGLGLGEGDGEGLGLGDGLGLGLGLGLGEGDGLGQLGGRVTEVLAEAPAAVPSPQGAKVAAVMVRVVTPAGAWNDPPNENPFASLNPPLPTTPTPLAVT